MVIPFGGLPLPGKSGILPHFWLREVREHFSADEKCSPQEML
jgi:hypothetical protein